MSRLTLLFWTLWQVACDLWCSLFGHTWTDWLDTYRGHHKRRCRLCRQTDTRPYAIEGFIQQLAKNRDNPRAG
ncbi:MAG: hypothetical protein EOO40_07120 [Deltaproteobacteria bacterium]|nr:MAG: hypothetical protein EOO40_07120 [Deltaproteobacteria bacterium]